MVGMRASCQPDAGVQDRRRAGLLDGLGELHDFRAGQTAFHQVKRGNAEHDDEVGAGRGARLAHDLAGESHCGSRAGRPDHVLPLAGAQREELGWIRYPSEPATSTPVMVPPPARENGGTHQSKSPMVCSISGAVQFARRARIDAGFHRRGRDDVLMKAVAAGVQDLQHDAVAAGRRISTAWRHGLVPFLASSRLLHLQRGARRLSSPASLGENPAH